MTPPRYLQRPPAVVHYVTTSGAVLAVVPPVTAYQATLLRMQGAKLLRRADRRRLKREGQRGNPWPQAELLDALVARGDLP